MYSAFDSFVPSLHELDTMCYLLFAGRHIHYIEVYIYNRDTHLYAAEDKASCPLTVIMRDPILSPLSSCTLKASFTASLPSSRREETSNLAFPNSSALLRRHRSTYYISPGSAPDHLSLDLFILILPSSLILGHDREHNHPFSCFPTTPMQGLYQGLTQFRRLS